MSSVPESSTIESTGLQTSHLDPSEFEWTLDGVPYSALGILGLFTLGASLADYSPNETTLIYDRERRGTSDYLKSPTEWEGFRRGITARLTRPICYLRAPESRSHIGWIKFGEFEPSAIGNFGRMVSSNNFGLTKSTIAGESARAYATETIAEGATEFPGVDHQIESVILFTLHSLLKNSHEEVYEDGMDSELSRKLHAMIRGFGTPCVTILGRLLELNSTNAEVASEVLRQVGLLEHPQSHSSRLKLLVAALKFGDPRLRDAASIGLSSMEDPAAIVDLEKAISVENSVVVKRNLILVLDQFLGN